MSYQKSDNHEQNTKKQWWFQIITKKKASDVNIYFFGKKKYTPFLIIQIRWGYIHLHEKNEKHQVPLDFIYQ